MTATLTPTGPSPGLWIHIQQMLDGIGGLGEGDQNIKTVTEASVCTKPVCKFLKD